MFSDKLKLFFVFLGIILGIVFFIFLFNNFFPSNNLGSENESPIADNQQLSINYFALAIKEMNITKCEFIKENMMKDNCKNTIYLNLSKTNLNLEGCNLLTNNMSKIECRNFISLNLAIKTEDKSYCNNFDNTMQKDMCINKVLFIRAYSNLNLSYCDEFETSYDKNSCIKNISLSLAEKNLDVKYCDNLDNMNKESCIQKTILEKAIKISDINLCKQINEDMSKNNCFIKFIENLNESNLDIKYCSYLSEMQRETCEKNVIMNEVFVNKDISLCNKLNNTIVKRDCIYFTAYNFSLETLDIKYCSYLSDIDNSRCILNTINKKARILNQSSICSELKEEMDKSMCLSYFKVPYSITNETIS